MRLSICIVWKKRLNECSISLFSRTNDVRSVLCSIEKWWIARILMSLSLRCKWYSLIYVSVEILTKLVSRRKKSTVNLKKNYYFDEKNSQNRFFDSRNFFVRSRKFCRCDWIFEFCHVWCSEALRLFVRWFQ